jgi:hypothetical protein
MKPVFQLLSVCYLNSLLVFYLICFSVCLSVFTYHLTFPLFQRLPSFSRHICQFTELSYVKFRCFITFSTVFSYLTSPRPRCPLSFGNQDIILSGHLLSCLRTTCPYNFNIFFSVFPKYFVVLAFFPDYFIPYFKQLFSINPFPY